MTVLIAADWNTDFVRKQHRVFINSSLSYTNIHYSFDHTNTVKDFMFIMIMYGSSYIYYYLMFHALFNTNGILSYVVLWDKVNLSPHQSFLLSVPDECSITSTWCREVGNHIL